MEDHFDRERREFEPHERAEIRAGMDLVRSMDQSRRRHSWLRWVAYTSLKVFTTVMGAVTAGYVLWMKFWGER